MSASRLSGRLSRIRTQARGRDSAGNDPGGTRPEAGSTGPVLEGWDETAPYLLERTHTVSVPGLAPAFSAHFPLLFPKERQALEGLCDNEGFVERLRFFDLETTGLSRGAGTVAFLAGIGRLERTTAGGRGPAGYGVSVTQILMTDFPGEVAFLRRLSEVIGTDVALVSFNGKCFDAQILWNRYLMAGLRPAFLSPDVVHLDLLFPSRRLWKASLESCRLSSIEEGIMGMSRVDDVPGSEAPEAWFSFVRGGDPALLRKISEHNLTDCHSLARLSFALDGAISRAEGRAGLIRALDLRKRGLWRESAALLDPLARQGDPVATRLLAIDCEHRIGDLPRALLLAEAMNDDGRRERVLSKMRRRDIS